MKASQLRKRTHCLLNQYQETQDSIFPPIDMSEEISALVPVVIVHPVVARDTTAVPAAIPASRARKETAFAEAAMILVTVDKEPD